MKFTDNDGTVTTYPDSRSYFDYDKNFIYSSQSLDIAIEKYLKKAIFPNDENFNRIIYASNEYTFRKRSDGGLQEGEELKSGNLNLPYINYHLKPGGFHYDNEFNWRQYSGYRKGVFIDELGAYVKFMPVVFEYEATFWCSRDEEARYVATKAAFDQGDVNNPIEYAVQIERTQTTIPLLGKLFIEGADMDSQYNEKDWLERNSIHSVGIDFNVKTFVIDTDYDVSIPDFVIFEFTTQHGVDETFTDAERLNFVINHFNETLEQVPSL